MKGNIKTRLRSGVRAQALSQLTQIGIRLGELPLLIGPLGLAQYGLWLTVTAIPSWLTVADGGFAVTTGREMTIRHARNDREGVLNVFNTSLAIVAGLALGMCVLLLGGLWLAWALHFPAADDAIYLTIGILVVHTALALLNNLLYGCYACVGEYGRGANVVTFTQLLEFVGTVAGASLGKGIMAAAVGLVAARLVGLGLNIYVLRKTVPWLQVQSSRFSAVEAKALMLPSLGALTFPLGNAANIQGVRVLTAALLGVEAVAIFSALRTLTRVATQPTMIVSKIIEPELAAAFGRADSVMVKKIFSRAWMITVTLSGVAGLAVIAVAPELVSFWSRGQIPFAWTPFLLLLACSVVASLWYTGLQVYYATNRAHQVAVPYVAIYGGVCAALVYFGARWEVSGVAAALLVTEVVMLIYVYPKARAITSGASVA